MINQFGDDITYKIESAKTLSCTGLFDGFKQKNRKTNTGIPRPYSQKTPILQEKCLDLPIFHGQKNPATQRAAGPYIINPWADSTYQRPPKPRGRGSATFEMSEIGRQVQNEVRNWAIVFELVFGDYDWELVMDFW